MIKRKVSPSMRVIVLTIVAFVSGRHANASEAHDWLAWGGSSDRSGWARSESAISRDNVSKMALKWRLQLDVAPRFEVLSTAASPLFVEAVQTPHGVKDVLFVVANDDTVYALDSGDGTVLWKRRYLNALKPKVEATYLCPNTQNATPVIDKQNGIVYVLTSDGKLRGLSMSSGDDLMPPTDFVEPFTRSWSLNLIDGVIYTPVARGCAGSISHFAAIDVSKPTRPQARFFTSVGRAAGAWGQGGMVAGPKGLYAQTSDGPYDPAAGKFGNSVLAMNWKDLRLLDSFTPSNADYLNKKDLDLGSASPISFGFKKWSLLAVSSKQALLYLLDANLLGGADHHTPLYEGRFGNDEDKLWGRGVWGSMSTWEDADGQRWLVVPMWGPPSKQAPGFQYSYGAADEGSLMAFRLGVENNKPTLAPTWMSRNMHVPSSAVIANGVVFSVATGENTRQGGYFPPEVRAKPFSHAILYAFDAATGQELYSSGELIDSWAHFGGIAVAKGRVYFCTWDGSVYAFGVQ